MRITHQHPSDSQQCPPGAYCTLCGGELYPGDTYWHINGSKVCPGCMGQFAREEFAAHRQICGQEASL